MFKEPKLQTIDYDTTRSKPATKFILLDYNFLLVNLVNIIILNRAMYPKITIIHKKKHANQNTKLTV